MFKLVLALYCINVLGVALIFKKFDYACFFIGIQLTMIEYFLIKDIKIIIANIKFKRNVEKIDKDDELKYEYYRDKLKGLTISEIGYIYQKKNTKKHIMATIESLKYRNIISIENGKIICNKSGILDEEEKYLINHYNEINKDSFKYTFEKKVKNSLIQKGYLINYNRIGEFADYKLVLVGWAFLISYGVGFTYQNSSQYLLNGILFLIVFVVFGSYAILLGLMDEKMCLKTELGKELYLKLLGLKNFLKDFGSFDDKLLKEIHLWEDYLLYAIILNCSFSLDKEMKKEYSDLKKVIKKRRH